MVAEPSERSTNVSSTTSPTSVSPFEYTPASYDASRASFTMNEIHDELTAVSTTYQASNAVEDNVSSIEKDLYLFDHYMDHTCRDLEIIPDVAYAKKVGLPQLAAENQGVLCSMMALAAACLCIDILSGQSTGKKIEDFSELISIGDRYHRIGIQSVRQQLATNQARDLAEGHAHTILLLPYALARRRISHLLNDVGPPIPMSGVDMQAEHLSSVEWIIILRGITTTGRASESTVYMDHSVTASGMDRPPRTHPLISSHILTKSAEQGSQHTTWHGLRNHLASKHHLFPVISATRVVALEALHLKAEKTNHIVRDHQRKHPALDPDQSSIQMAWNTSLSACFMAVDLLVNLERTIFNPEPRPLVPASPESQFDNHPLPWLRRYAKDPVYDPALPALQTVLSWVNRTPEEYFQLLMKPLPALSNSQGDSPAWSDTPDIDREIQLLAWDIWAHWLVFAILIEGESFFTASLGVPDIINLSPYFRGSVSESPSSNASPTAEGQDWWPGSMCSVAQQLRRFEGKDSPVQNPQSFDLF